MFEYSINVCIVDSDMKKIITLFIGLFFLSSFCTSSAFAYSNISHYKSVTQISCGQSGVENSDYTLRSLSCEQGGESDNSTCAYLAFQKATLDKPLYAKTNHGKQFLYYPQDNVVGFQPVIKPFYKRNLPFYSQVKQITKNIVVLE